MDTPQEVEVWVVLPALRRQLATSLKKQGMKQKEIASLFNITEAAVSMYLSKKRGDETTFTKKIMDEIDASSKNIAKDKSKAMYEVQRLMKIISDTKHICNICHSHINTSKECKICYA
jgi:predicted transcriptional regulator